MKSNSTVTAKSLPKKLCKSFSLLLAFLLLCSHDLYIKMETYFLQPNQEATLSLYNGTFENSENIISRDRILDASVITSGKRVAITPNQWHDQDSTVTQLTFHTGEAGTYVVGVSTKARSITLPAEEFNNYLEHDGVLDMLEYRTKNNLLDQNAVESYQKHVKAIYQVGASKTTDWNTALGYPIEFVPQANPYEKYSGDQLEVQLLLDGKPLPNQLVYADYIKSPHAHTHNDHTHTHQATPGETHTHTSGQKLRTDEQGMVLVTLPEDGIYYLRTIHLVALPDSDTLTHQSKWATLTFEVSHQHDASTHTHGDQEEQSGIPTWGLIVGSLLILGLLVLVFRKNT